MPTWPRLLRDVADFPKPGIVFKDITPVLADASAFAELVAGMAAPWRQLRPDAIIGIESRGFILGAAMARELDCGFVPIRKPGKLPSRTLSREYALEYGTGRLDIHADALPPGSRAVIVDDVLATGGTLAAAAHLVRLQGMQLLGASVLVEIASLQGRNRWIDPTPLHALLAC